LEYALQNSDPERRGRIKVYVPHVSVTMYDNWHKDKVDKTFKFPDKVTNPDLINIIDPLKDVLPWAECASPLFGGNASGRYNAYTEKGTTSDTNYWENDVQEEGNRSLQRFVSGADVYPDAFTKTGENNNKFVNEYAYQYTPSNYSNLARGLFTIPNVGSHVWVFFADGNPNLPVYFAASHGQEDWKRIYSMDQEPQEDFTSVDYPGAYENRTKSDKADIDIDNKTFRAKTVFNSNKHSIELVDTDNREILKMTHFSGSFKEFTNYANIELATNNDQKMVLGDQFYTVQKNQSIYVGKNQDVIITKDRYKTIGLKKYQTAEKILKILKEIHEYKRLFDARRAIRGEDPNEVSKYQLREQNNDVNEGSGFASCPVCGGNPYEPGTWNIVTPTWGTSPPTQESLIASSNRFSDWVGEVGYWLGSPCAVCNPGNSDDNNRGFSPSTQDGHWLPEPHKQPGGAMEQLILSRTEELMELQRELGEGDEIISVSKNKVENIGLVINDMKSFRVDPIGKLRIDGVNVALEGVYATFKTSPHVEYVDVDDVPGGDYNLTCGNKYKLLVGAKGINIKTFGPMDMYGTIVNLIGEQVNISSQNEVLIDGGERFNIRARKISLIPIEHQPVVIDGQLHVTRNAIVGGGLFVEGELGVQHITGPIEYSFTEEQLYVTTGAPLEPGVSYHTHQITSHKHPYEHVAWKNLLPSKESVRDSMRTQEGE